MTNDELSDLRALISGLVQTEKDLLLAHQANNAAKLKLDWFLIQLQNKKPLVSNATGSATSNVSFPQ